MSRFRLTSLLLAIWLVAACEQSDTAVPVSSVKSAQRIVTLAPSLTEFVFAVGAGERLVGTVDYSDYPAAAQSIPRVGDAFRVDYEMLSRLQPDLVLVWESGNPPEVVDRIKEQGYRVVSMEPTSLDSIAEQLLLVGELTGMNEQAVIAAADYRAKLASLRSAEYEPQLTVFWQISADPWFTVTGQHVISEMLAMCGGRNIFADLPGLAPAVTLEAILAERPQVVIASIKPGNTDWQAGWEIWQEVPAVKSAALYQVDPDLVSRPGPRLTEGAADVCAILEAARH